MQITAPASTCATSWKEMLCAPAWLGTRSWLMGFPVKVSAWGSPQSVVKCSCTSHPGCSSFPELGVAVPAERALAEGIPVLPHRHLLKHSLAVTWPGGGKPGLLLFSDIAGFFPALLVSLPTQVPPQVCVHSCGQSVFSQNRSSEQDRGTLLSCAPSGHSSALASALFAFSSSGLGSLSSGRLQQLPWELGQLQVFTCC